MVICFSVKQAREHLMREGYVYTFRWNERKNIGKNWANSGRTTSKIANVNIDEPRLIESPSDLDIYVADSGFNTKKDWLDVIMSMSKHLKTFNQMHGYMYLVTNCDTCGWYHSAKNRCCYLDNQCNWVSQDSQQLRNKTQSIGE